MNNKYITAEEKYDMLEFAEWKRNKKLYDLKVVGEFLKKHVIDKDGILHERRNNSDLIYDLQYLADWIHNNEVFDIKQGKNIKQPTE